MWPGVLQMAASYRRSKADITLKPLRAASVHISGPYAASRCYTAHETPGSAFRLAVFMGAWRLMKPLRIVLADDHNLVRSGLKSLLSGMQGVEVVAEAVNGMEAAALAGSAKPDVVLMDI